MLLIIILCHKTKIFHTKYTFLSFYCTLSQKGVSHSPIKNKHQHIPDTPAKFFPENLPVVSFRCLDLLKSDRVDQ